MIKNYGSNMDNRVNTKFDEINFQNKWKNTYCKSDIDNYYQKWDLVNYDSKFDHNNINKTPYILLVEKYGFLLRELDILHKEYKSRTYLNQYIHIAYSLCIAEITTRIKNL